MYFNITGAAGWGVMGIDGNQELESNTSATTAGWGKEGKKWRKTNIPGGFSAKEKRKKKEKYSFRLKTTIPRKRCGKSKSATPVFPPEGRWELWFAPFISVYFPQHLALQHPGCFARTKLPQSLLVGSGPLVTQLRLFGFRFRLALLWGRFWDVTGLNFAGDDPLLLLRFLLRPRMPRRLPTLIRHGVNSRGAHACLKKDAILLTGGNNFDVKAADSSRKTESAWRWSSVDVVSDKSKNPCYPSDLLREENEGKTRVTFCLQSRRSSSDHPFLPRATGHARRPEKTRRAWNRKDDVITRGTLRRKSTEDHMIPFCDDLASQVHGGSQIHLTAVFPT
ncbi:hypothetical protein L345_17312, partial [Ophiophagus hannah]